MANDENDKETEGRSKQPLVLAFILLLAGGAALAGYWNASSRVSEPAVVAQTSTSSQKTTQPEAQAQVKAAAQPAVKQEPQQVAEPAAPEVQTQPKSQPQVNSTAEPKASTAVEIAPAETPKSEPDPQQVAVVAPKAPPAVQAPAPAEPQAVEQKAPEVEPAAAAQQPEEPIDAPSFDTVRVAPNGDTVIAGRAKPGAEVSIKHSGQVIGKVVADDSGSFAFVTEKPLPAGAGSLTLETQDGGKTQVSEQTVAVAVKGENKGEALVAVVKPDQPAQIVQAPTSEKSLSPSISVVLDSVDYDATGNIIFSGRGKPNATVRLYVDNAPAGEAKTDADGRWMFAGSSAVPSGTHMLRADEIGADGKVVSRVELPFLREEASKVVAAAEPAAAASVAEIAANGEPPSAEASVPNATAPAVVEPSRMVIQPGNSLWKLSRQVYGKGVRYTVIWEANKDQIRDPNLIYPGQIFVMPTEQP